MKRFAPLLCLLGSALVMAGGAQARSSDDHGCGRAHAVGVGQDLGGGNTTATISHGGRLNGTTAAHFDLTGGAFPVFTIAGTLVFTTKHGTLDATLSGTLNVATGEFNASGPVSGGTGQLAGTTGNLTFHGFEDLTTGAFTETISGTLCKGGDGDDGEGD